MAKVAVGNDIIPFNINPNKDSVTSSKTGWTSGHIQLELDKKATKTEINSIESRISNDSITQANKVDKSQLGTQAVFELRGNDLYITTK